jgi:hypothetical protein
MMFSDMLKPVLYLYAIVGVLVIAAIAGVSYLIGRWGG